MRYMHRQATLPDPSSGLSSQQMFRFCMLSLHFIRRMSYHLCVATISTCFSTKKNTYLPTSKPGTQRALVEADRPEDEPSLLVGRRSLPDPSSGPTSFSQTHYSHCCKCEYHQPKGCDYSLFTAPNRTGPVPSRK